MKRGCYANRSNMLKSFQVLAILTACIAGIMLSACEGLIETGNSIRVTGIALDASSATVAEGATRQLTAVIAPANASNRNMTWSSGNEAVATVSAFGLVTAKAAGTATITVTTEDGGKTAQCVVTVPSPYVVGGAGPAGGLVFYDKGSYSDGWRYLEAAPASTEWADGYYSNYSEAMGCENYEIGSGKSNTAAIIAWHEANGHGTETGYAAKLCDDLSVTNAGTVYDDWFLPSLNELKEMKVNLYDKDLGSIRSTYNKDNYWSSSECVGVPQSGMILWISPYASQNTGKSDSGVGDITMWVRAVRRF